MLAKVVLKGDGPRLVLTKVLPAPGVVKPLKKERLMVHMDGWAGGLYLTVYRAGNEIYADPAEAFAL